MVNEMKMLCDRMNIDVWEVIHAASTKPFGFMPFYPGPGLGGHCIPIDPFYLTWKAREFEFHTKFIELAGEVNTADAATTWCSAPWRRSTSRRRRSTAPRSCASARRTRRTSTTCARAPSCASSPCSRSTGAEVDYHDPYVPKLEKGHGFNYDMKSVPLTDEALAGYDAVLILTDHSNIDYNDVVKHSSVVVDTRNACKNVGPGREKVTKA